MSETPVTLLRLRTVSRALDVGWADGTSATLPYHILRGRCPCGTCRQRRRIAAPFTLPQPVDVTAILPCGPNAVQIVFSDGHDRGIFPFSYLRELGDITRAVNAGISK